ncbi:hypothetical protein F7734_50410 [Scytonema sp. UIC 10036]|uniref:DEAD/DEAH box helicase family protein n=1 Tax=Scytonema sp. UIC 10036 TaxID=2304196 RepID=UPI0012DA9716|nr:DEAD/DEAH box helicase family protein [Scytonema sp. UIC 10036]MUH00056.1 hypothetical protein [Scytonema sp. UIC 10036]
MIAETNFSIIDQYFQTLTTFLPRDFQRKTVAKLLQRQNILLRAPTGSGKTETAIAHCWRNLIPFHFFSDTNALVGAQGLAPLRPMYMYYDRDFGLGQPKGLIQELCDA